MSPAANPAKPGALGQQVVDVVRRDELGARLAVHVDELSEQELDVAVADDAPDVVLVETWGAPSSRCSVEIAMREVYPPQRGPGNGRGTAYRWLGCALRTYGREASLTATSEARGLREENRTLYRVINLVASSIELGPMLQGIVDLATEATDCHACFIYLLEDGLLTMRAASPVYSGAVGVVQMRLDEGLTGWVARHKTPEFIRENAMADPRMKFFPVLEEERFQSMVAVPILSRAGESIGVIVLHTEAPREFTEDTLKLLVHIASLVSGAIENAQLYDQQRRRVDALTSLSGLAQEVATATTPSRSAAQ